MVAFRASLVRNRSDLDELLKGFKEVLVHFAGASAEFFELLRTSGTLLRVSEDFDPLSDLDFASDLV